MTADQPQAPAQRVTEIREALAVILSVAEYRAQVGWLLDHLSALRAELEAGKQREAALRDALSNLQNVVADADSVGEMQGEDVLMEPWSSLSAHSEKYFGLLAAVTPRSEEATGE